MNKFVLSENAQGDLAAFINLIVTVLNAEAGVLFSNEDGILEYCSANQPHSSVKQRFLDQADVIKDKVLKKSESRIQFKLSERAGMYSKDFAWCTVIQISSKFSLCIFSDSTIVFSDVVEKHLKLICKEIASQLGDAKGSLNDIENLVEVDQVLKVLNCSDDFVGLMDIGQATIRINKSWKRVLCSRESESELTLEAFVELSHADYQQNARKFIQRILDEGDSEPFETLMNATSGAFIPVEWKISQDSDLTILTGKDISNEYALKKEYQRARTLLSQAEEVAHLGIYEVDFIEDKIYWSDVTKAIHEVGDDYVPELEGAIEFYKEGESRDKITDAVEKAISEGEEYSLELIIVTAKGNERWVRARGIPRFQNGKCLNLFGTFQDITSEREVYELQKRFIEQAPSSIAMFDVNMNFIAVSDKWCEEHENLPPDEVVGRNLYDLNEYLPEGWKEYHKRGLCGEHITKEEDHYVDEEGRDRWSSWRLKPWYNQNLEIGGVLIYAQDITAQKLAEKLASRNRGILESTIDTIDAGIVAFDQNKSVTVLNSKAKDWLNVSSKILLDKKWDSMFEFIKREDNELSDINELVDQVYQQKQVS